MAGRRPPRVFTERLVGAVESMIPGTVGGRVSNASPVPAGTAAAAISRGVAGSSVQASGVLFKRDRFDLPADGAQDLTLTYHPLTDSQHVYLNGVEADEGTDYTLDGVTLSLLTAAGALTDDVIEVRYAYDVAAPTTPSDLGAFSDDFNRANSSTTLGSPWLTFATGTDTTNGWNTSTWGISSNRAYLTALATDGLGDVATAIAYIDGASPDGQLDVDITTAPGAFDDIAAFRIDPSLGTPANRSAYIVTKGALFWVAPGVGGAQVGSNFSTALSSGDHLTVILSGGSVDIQRNGSSVYTNTLANNLTMTKHGIAATDVSARFDNFAWTPA